MRDPSPPSRPPSKPPTYAAAWAGGRVDPQTGKPLDKEFTANVHPARFNDPKRRKENEDA